MPARRPCRAALSGQRQEIGFTLKAGSAHKSTIVYAKPILKLSTGVVPSAIFFSCKHSNSAAIEAGQGTRPPVGPNIKICRVITSRLVKRWRIGYRRLALNEPAWPAATVWPLGLDPHLIGCSGVGGMISSTVLTLCVIPALYALVKQWQLRRELAKAPALPLTET